MLATLWMGASAALVTYSFRLPDPPPGHSSAENVPWILACWGAATVAFGCGVGVLCTRPLVGALLSPLVAVGLIALLRIVFWLI